MQETSFSIGLCIDNFKICSPLGTSRTIHKITAVYWILLNLPAGFRTTLPLIQLSHLGKSVDVKQFGYDAALHPLIQDLVVWKQMLVFVEVLNPFVKGTIFFVCELRLCLNDLVRKGFITFDGLNSCMKQFPYKHSDKVNNPMTISH